MRRRFTTLLTAAMAMALIVGTSTRAEATAALRLFDGTTTITIQDQQPVGGVPPIGDFNPLVGGVTWIGTLGLWSLNVSTGTTYPILGSIAAPEMDLNSVNTSSAPATLTISFTQTDFTGVGGAELSVGGTQTTCGAGCTINYSAFWSASNAQFATTTPIGAPLASGATPAFALSGGGAVPGPGPYSLTQVVTITRGAAGATSFDAHLRVPEPASMALFGLGMLGFGIASRRRRTV